MDACFWHTPTYNENFLITSLILLLQIDDLKTCCCSEPSCIFHDKSIIRSAQWTNSDTWRIWNNGGHIVRGQRCECERVRRRSEHERIAYSSIHIFSPDKECGICGVDGHVQTEQKRALTRTITRRKASFGSCRANIWGRRGQSPRKALLDWTRTAKHGGSVWNADRGTSIGVSSKTNILLIILKSRTTRKLHVLGRNANLSISSRTLIVNCHREWALRGAIYNIIHDQSDNGGSNRKASVWENETLRNKGHTHTATIALFCLLWGGVYVKLSALSQLVLADGFYQTQSFLKKTTYSQNSFLYRPIHDHTASFSQIDNNRGHARLCKCRGKLIENKDSKVAEPFVS